MIKLVSLFSGSSGNSIFVSSGNTKILVDAGLSGKRIEAAIREAGEDPALLSGIFITHEHSDHTTGAGILARRFKIPVFATEGTWNEIRKPIGKLLPEQCRVIRAEERFTLGEFEICAFPIPHDAAEPVGYSFHLGQRKVTIATDIGHMNENLLNHLHHSDMLLLESNHDIDMLKAGRYPWPLKQRILSEHGHLCNDMAGKTIAWLAENGTRIFLLGHLSEENNFPELAWQTTINALSDRNLHVGEDLTVEVANRDRTSRAFVLDG